MDRNGCAECKIPKATRYTEDNSCVGCMTKFVSDCWRQWCQGDPGRPDPWSTDKETSARLGLDWFYGSPHHMELCRNGPHLRKTHITRGHCVACEEAKSRIRALARGPRAAARAAGHKTYLPEDACPECGQIAPRNTQSNWCSGCYPPVKKAARAAARAAGHKTYLPEDACPECGRHEPRNVITNECLGCKLPDSRRTESQIFAEENPDFVIDKDGAVALGFTLYRTGLPCRRGHTSWRYVSTGNCLECLRGDK